MIRKFVDKMISQFDWPNFEEDRIRKSNKVINEEDFMPLHFIHLLLKTAKLIRKFKNKAVITKNEKKH